MSPRPDSVSHAEIERYFEWCDQQGFDHIAEAKAELDQLHGVLDQLDDDA